MSLIDLITGQTGNEVASQAENKLGISKNQVIALLAVAAPLVISYLKKKSEESHADANALNDALDKDHDGSILNNPAQAAERQQEGDSIISHIFGTDKSLVENRLSQSSGISMDKIGPALAMLAPLIMGYIGKQKQRSNVSGGGLGDLLGGILGGAQRDVETRDSNPLTDLLGSVLGGASGQLSGNSLDDMLGSILGGKGGGIGDMLGGLFGSK